MWEWTMDTVARKSLPVVPRAHRSITKLQRWSAVAVQLIYQLRDLPTRGFDFASTWLILFQVNHVLICLGVISCLEITRLACNLLIMWKQERKLGSLKKGCIKIIFGFSTTIHFSYYWRSWGYEWLSFVCFPQRKRLETIINMCINTTFIYLQILYTYICKQ